MNICILFILFNGSAYVTPACFTTSVMMKPHDVVYLEHIPEYYVDNVFESPRYYYYSHFNNKRYIRSYKRWRYRTLYRHHYQRRSKPSYPSYRRGIQRKQRRYKLKHHKHHKHLKHKHHKRRHKHKQPHRRRSHR